MEFFTAHIRNPHTRKAYARACAKSSRSTSPPTSKNCKAGWRRPRSNSTLPESGCSSTGLVVSQVLPTNPASAVRGPKLSVTKGTTPVLTAAEARDLLDSIVTDTLPALLDHALIALMIYTFGRVGALLKMRTEDVFIHGRRTRVRLRGKGGKRHEMPCHHKLEAYLQDYAAALPASPPPDPKAWLFPTALGPSRPPLQPAHVPGRRLPHDPQMCRRHRHHRIPPQRPGFPRRGRTHPHLSR